MATFEPTSERGGTQTTSEGGGTQTTSEGGGTQTTFEKEGESTGKVYPARQELLNWLCEARNKKRGQPEDSRIWNKIRSKIVEDENIKFANDPLGSERGSVNYFLWLMKKACKELETEFNVDRQIQAELLGGHAFSMSERYKESRAVNIGAGAGSSSAAAGIAQLDTGLADFIRGLDSVNILRYQKYTQTNVARRESSGTAQESSDARPSGESTESTQPVTQTVPQAGIVLDTQKTSVSAGEPTGSLQPVISDYGVLQAGDVLQFPGQLFGTASSVFRTSNLYIREAYLDVAALIFANYWKTGGDQNDESMQRLARDALYFIGRKDYPLTIRGVTVERRIVSGTPGIGKSSCLAFISYLCRRVRIPFYLIGHINGAFNGEASSGSPALRRRALYLLDHDYDPKSTVFGGNVVLFTSPQPARLDAWLNKHGPTALRILTYMNVWSYDELNDLMEKCFPHRSVLLMGELHKHFGGSVRFAIPENQDDNDEAGVRALVLQKIDEKIASLDNEAKIIDALNAKPEDLDSNLSHPLIHHVCPEGKNVCGSLDVCFLPGSAYIRDALSSQARRVILGRALINFLVLDNNDKAALLRGRLYEPLVVEKFCSQWILGEHKCKYLGQVLKGHSTPKKAMGKNLPSRGFERKHFAGISTLCEAFLNAGDEHVLNSGDSTFPVGNILRKGQYGYHLDIHQVTTRLDHPISYEGLIRIAEEIRHALGLANNVNLAVRLFFCVPRKRYQKFKEQKTKHGREVVACPEDISLLQYCLEVPIENIYKPITKKRKAASESNDTELRESRESKRSSSLPVRFAPVP